MGNYAIRSPFFNLTVLLSTPGNILAGSLVTKTSITTGIFFSFNDFLIDLAICHGL